MLKNSKFDVMKYFTLIVVMCLFSGSVLADDALNILFILPILILPVENWWMEITDEVGQAKPEPAMPPDLSGGC